MYSIKQYQDVIEGFEKIPSIPKRPPTFMEISGYPHFENVCSNILRFFLDTSEIHGLQNLVLKSLLQSIGEHELANQLTDAVSVRREETTIAGKRIDIVIECDSLVIAIENKIYHWLHNDLEEYNRHIGFKKSTTSKRLLIVLSLRPENIQTGNFKNLTYEILIPVIRKNLESHIVTGSNHYITHLNDFITTIENLYKPTPMNKEMFHFIADNYSVIEQIQRECKSFLNDIYNAIWKLHEKIPPKGVHVKKWIWEKWVLVHDFDMGNEIMVSVDCGIDFKSTSVEVFLRQGSVEKESYLKSLDLFSGDTSSYVQTGRGGYIIYKEETAFFELDIDKLAATLNGILDKIKIIDKGHD
ncbi:MAG: PD-(D/E)XK nuclease family protein [Sphingobacteriales bacterium]|nr:PD-(D/E)XK nuclease family protein [Sphingobacteriales bacterium]